MAVSVTAVPGMSNSLIQLARRASRSSPNSLFMAPTMPLPKRASTVLNAAGTVATLAEGAGAGISPQIVRKVPPKGPQLNADLPTCDAAGGPSSFSYQVADTMERKLSPGVKYRLAESTVSRSSPRSAPSRALVNCAPLR